MFYRYKVKFYYEVNHKDDSQCGIVHSEEDSGTGYQDAIMKVWRHYDNINEITLAELSDDSCLIVDSDALREIEDNVNW